jgi:protein TonB
LKERLARQEAAARLLDAPPPPAPVKAAAPAPKAEPVKPIATPVRAEPPKPQPAPPPPPAVIAKAEPVKPEPAKAEPPPAPPPRIEVAAAKPSAAPAPVTRLVQRVEPDYPREAILAGENAGAVQARMTLDERGNVVRVEVMEARPRRLFDRAVIRALSQWKYSEGAAGRTVEAEISFKR